MADVLTLAIVVTIAGVDRTTYIDGGTQLDFTRMLFGIGQARFDTWDPAGTYAPVEGDSVVISLGGTVRWRGEVDAVDNAFLGATAGLLAHVTASYCTQILQRDVINTTYAAGVEKAILQALTASGTVMAGYGMTLAAGQVDGPTLGTVSAPWMTPEAILQYVSTLTGDVYDVDPTLVLEMWTPGTKATGITISPSSGYLVDCTWRRHRFDYRNREIVSFGSSGVAESVDDTWIGDGGSRIFPLHYAPLVVPTYCKVSGTSYPVGVYGASGFTWTYRASDNSIYQDSGAAALTTSDMLTVSLWIAYPQVATANDLAEQGAHGVWARADSFPNVLAYADAIAQARGLITQNKPMPPVPLVTVTADGIVPGWTVIVDIPAIGLVTQTCLVQQVETRAQKSGDLAQVEHVLTVVAGDTRVSTARDIWRQFLLGAGLSSAIGSGAASGSGSAITTISAAAQRTAYPLGGGDIALLEAPSTDWMTVRQAVRVRCDWSTLAGATVAAYLQVHADAAGVQVTPRIVAVDDAGAVLRVVGTGTAALSAGTFASGWSPIQIALLSPGSGTEDLVLQVSTDTVGALVSATGYLEGAGSGASGGGAIPVSATLRYEPLTNGFVDTPELVFALGDVIMAEVYP